MFGHNQRPQSQWHSRKLLLLTMMCVLWVVVVVLICRPVLVNIIVKPAAAANRSNS